MHSGTTISETQFGHRAFSIVNHVMLPLYAVLEKQYTVTELTPAAVHPPTRLSSFQRMPSQLHQFVV